MSSAPQTQWSTSDPNDVSLSVNISNTDEVNAVCNNATSGPVTITIHQFENSENGTGTAQLTCK